MRCAITFVAVLLSCLLPASMHGDQRSAVRLTELGVVNGNFSDLAGMSDQGGGWFRGVPVGWKATGAFPLYAVHAGTDGKQPACNVSQLGCLEQNIGTLAQAH